MATKNELEKSKVRKETTAKFFFDMAKLTFAALVLGVAASLLNREIEDEIPSMSNYLFAMGFIGTVAFVTVVAIVAVGILAYTYTPSGKRWIENM